MNNLANIIPLTTFLKRCILPLLIISSINIQAQELSYSNGEKYIIGEISVAGNTSFSEQTIVTYSGLTKGKEIAIPGEYFFEVPAKPNVIGKIAAVPKPTKQNPINAGQKYGKVIATKIPSEITVALKI